MRKVAALAAMLALSGCGILDMTEKTHKEVQRSNDLQQQMLGHISKTSEAVHLQVLTLAMQQMLAPENTANLNPPIRMMPYAEVFSKEASAEELIKVCYVLWTDAKESDSRGRMVSLVAMSALAALAPEAKAAEIRRTQIDEGGRYVDAAYAFTLSRYVFTRDFLLAPILEKTKYLSLGGLKESVSHFDILRGIRGLPYQDRLVLTIPALEVNEVVPAAELQAIGEKARRRFTEGLETSSLGSLEVQDLLKRFAP